MINNTEVDRVFYEREQRVFLTIKKCFQSFMQSEQLSGMRLEKLMVGKLVAWEENDSLCAPMIGEEVERTSVWTCR